MKKFVIGGIILALISVFGIYRFMGRNTLVISSSGTYEISDNIKNIEVKAKDVVIINAKLADNIIINEKVKNGNVTIRDSKIKGKLLISGGESNFVYIESSKINKILANHKGVSIVIDSDSKVKKVNVNKNTTLKISGDIALISLSHKANGSHLTLEKESSVTKIESAAKIKLNVLNNIEEIIIKEKATNSVLEINAFVNKIDMNAKTNLNINENGEITNILALKNATESTINIKKEGKVYAIAALTNIIVNGNSQKIVTSNKEFIKGNTQTRILISDNPITINSNGNNINLPKEEPIVIVPEYVSLKNIIIKENNKTIKWGEIYKLELTYLPINATNKKVLYTSSNTNIATVDENGIVKGINKGTATITVESADKTIKTEIIINVSLNINNILSTRIINYNTVEVVLDNNRDYTFKFNDVDTKYTVFENIYTLRVNNFDEINKLEITALGSEDILKNDIAKLSNMVIIKNTEDLTKAINNQVDGDIWCLKNGSYNLARFDTIKLEDETGWYFPITANNLTIVGESKDKVILTSDVVALDNKQNSKNFITVFGGNVKIDNLTILTLTEIKHAILIKGNNFAFTNSIVKNKEENLVNNAKDILFAPSNLTLDLGVVTLENLDLLELNLDFSNALIGTLNINKVNIMYENKDTIYPIIGLVGLNKVFINNIADFNINISSKMALVLNEVFNNLPKGTKVTLKEGIYIIKKPIVVPDDIILDKTLATIKLANDNITDEKINAWDKDVLTTEANINFNNIDIKNVKEIKFSLYNNDILLGTKLSTGTNLINLFKKNALSWNKTAETYLEVKEVQSLMSEFKVMKEETDDTFWINSICTLDPLVMPSKVVVEITLNDGTIYIS